MTNSVKISFLILLTLTLIVLFFILSPAIPQDPNYHKFVDTRTYLNIPNFANVLSNIPFCIFGIMGLRYLNTEQSNAQLSFKGERLLWQFFFCGSALVGIGSGYYHLHPTNATLVWDRLPMTIAFMSFLAIVIMERINATAGLRLVPILIILGIASVFYWDFTERNGAGDLRAYAIIQFLPMILIPLIFVLFPKRYSGIRYLIVALVCYILAKVFEYFDALIFTLLTHGISGHSLKHLAASLSIYAVFIYLQKRNHVNN